MILGETLGRPFRLFPRKKAIVCGDKHWTYQEFYNRVSRFSSCLKDLGVEKGDRVALLHPNCHVFLESYYAIAQIGAISVPINYRLSPQEIAFILKDSDSKILIADSIFEFLIEKVLEMGGGIETIIWSGAGELPNALVSLKYEKLLEQRNLAPLPEGSIHEEDIAQIYYTSGTTGRPKGVMLTHKNVTTHALSAIAEIQLTDCDVWIHVAPLFHLADAWATWAITWVGGTHIMVRDFEPKKVLEMIEKERVTLTNLIPTMINLMINHPEVDQFDYKSLRLLLSGGAPIAPEVVRKMVETFKCDYIQTYGMTETSPYLTLSILKDHLKRLSKEEQLQFKSKTGREFIGIELKVVNERGEEVQKNGKEVGEIIVRGDTVMRGYWKLPEETEKSMKEGWFYTGDLAVIDEEGYVTIVDRKKDMIITGGENVYSTEVEHILYTHPSILECAVIGIPDPKWGEVVKGIVVLKSGERATEQEIIQFCKERIASYKAPKSIDFMESLPKTGSGKIHKKALKEKYWKGYEKRVH